MARDWLVVIGSLVVVLFAAAFLMLTWACIAYLVYLAYTLWGVSWAAFWVYLLALVFVILGNIKR